MYRFDNRHCVSAICACVLLVAGCSDSAATGGTACGEATCGVGQICCIDCDGEGTCLEPGSTCDGTACGSPQPGNPCGDRSCAAGQVCCIDCDGKGTCGDPGMSCAGVACTAANPCKTGGCSGEMCVSADADPPDSACVEKPEYACYRRFSQCGPFGEDGQCAWEQNPQLQACLDEPCPTDCGAYCLGLGMAECPNPGCRCPDPPADCPEDCATWCSGERPECPNPGCGCETPCGGEHQLCCPGASGSCDEGLACCMGVPYHDTWGTCEKSCELDSDRDLKTEIAPVNAAAVLASLAAMPISTWRYKDEASRARHLGPMAQDFRRAFGLGTSERRIHAVDASGVTMAALQALLRRVQRLEQDNRALRRRIERTCARR